MASNNTSTHLYTGFVAEPDGRGTASLILSCLLTLILCVWQALHLNVPGEGQSSLECVLENFRWIIAGIYAPELVVFAAWRQWSSANILGHMVAEMYCRAYDADQEHRTSTLSQKNPQDLCDQPQLPILGQRRHHWTKSHSFFASTGGFAIHVPASLSNSFPSLPPASSGRLTLTARGIALLARCGHLPDIAEEDILDKSKANGLAKALVMLQAIWMLLQVGGRLIASLPVTLLEVNTVAHV